MSQPPSQPYSGQPYPGEPYPGQQGSGAGYPPPGQPSYPPPPQYGQQPPSYPPPPQYGQPQQPQYGQQPAYPQQGQQSFPPPNGPTYPQPDGYNAMQGGGFAPPPPKKKSTGLKIVLISLAVLLVLCVGGVAVAFFAVKDKAGDVIEAAKTTVVEPTTLMGRPKITDPELAGEMSSLETEMSQVPGATGSVGAIYGEPLKQDLVMVAAASSITGTPQGKFDDFVSGMEQGGFKADNMKDTPPGPLGGIAKCGSSKPSGVPMALCVWSDNGSIGMIAMMFKDVAALEKEFISMRGQIEQRTK